ncbi:unnamed protein product [Sphenostylis stenocarpa]|uniref:Leucine-rich repeat-containing N-terminal plant-type domain-containing protein n=1 Tax=Sphenostylis stenocarpa TaxID=92480 RepID=A0AA86W299_9FABA|nr:unnamed protein product [Sphenostylis stenocarpa]
MSNSNIHCNKKDMNTLLSFKQGLTDPSHVLSSWVPNLDCCQWSGVKCDNITGRVTNLDLPCHTSHPKVVEFGEKDDKLHCLSGSFSLSLLELEYLSYLNLSNNNFKSMQYNSIGSQKCDDLPIGNLSHLCGNSSNLRYLDLSQNYDLLVDNLHWISHLTSLQYLNLGGVYLHMDIDWLQSVTMLPSLSELHLKRCKLENIYPFLQHANFTSLQVLNLADNDFISELPGWLFNLSDISHIDLSQTCLHSQLPDALPNLRSIKSLILSHNYLRGPIPSWLGKLEQLQELDLSYNYFSGPIPVSLGNLSSLITLILESNDLNGNLPGELGQLFNLETLRVSKNSLTGIVSERNLGSLRNLKNFSISSPSLIFDFGPIWVPPFQLLNIELGNLKDKLPSWLFTQSSLKYLTIRDSTASFEPLDMFWNFTTQLESISLENNTINGDMSNVFLSSKVVWLVANNLRGGMPHISPEVVVLHLRNNSLSGSISPLLCHNNKRKKSNLVYLDMSYNNLSGELTDCWNDWKSLVLINFRFNNLTGMIPHSMGSLSNLRFLYLKSNKFFGKVPFSLRNCKNLRILDLCRNNLSGLIPSWLGQNVEGLELRSNKFSGNIPTQLCKLQSLMVINLASNKLSGLIPSCLHNITSMLSSHFVTRKFDFTLNYPGLSVYISCNVPMLIKGNELPYVHLMKAIDLSSNNLSGNVPLQIYMLTGLQSLNLSHNQLMGTIPEEIGNLEQLESIDLSSNNFSGEIPQSMSALHFLAVLNLSFNNFAGKIPAGTQLGSTNLSYIDNPDLCGPPLTKICPQDEKPPNIKPMGGGDDDKSEVCSWFYMGLGVGFAVGFWGILGTVFFNRRCRHAYFRLLHRICKFVIQKLNSITEI